MNQEVSSNASNEAFDVFKNAIFSGGMSSGKVRVYTCGDVSPFMKLQSPECGALIRATVTELLESGFNQGPSGTMVFQVNQGSITLMQDLKSDEKYPPLNEDGAFKLAQHIWEVYTEAHSAMVEMTDRAKGILEGKKDGAVTIH